MPNKYHAYIWTYDKNTFQVQLGHIAIFVVAEDKYLNPDGSLSKYANWYKRSDWEKCKVFDKTLLYACDAGHAIGVSNETI